jgi:hypothetical protein
MPRTFNEAETRAGMCLLMHQVVVTKQRVARWLVNKHRPTRDELMSLILELQGTEQEIANLSKLPPSSGHSFDFSIDRLQRESDRLAK